jgi:alpha-amylase
MHFLSLLRTTVSSQKFLSGALLASLLTPWFSSAQAVTTTPVPRTVMVHLFEWQWNDIASECETQLGPKGFSAVQVSPPQKSVSGSQWWTRYQPLSYAIEGRSGTRAEFASMVSRCKAVGVDIYVDAVINHMAALNRSFPEVPYGTNDFHTCTTPINYSDAWSIQNCDLSGLNDLKSESDYVRGKIADYLNDLTSLGVAGFRFDAAKHMPPADISNIVGRLTGHPYIYQEVIRGAGEPVQPEQYTYIADVMEFNYSKTVSYYFKGRGALKSLSNLGTANWSGWLASADAQVFVENHDNQRQDTGNIITYKDGGNLNTLAHVFMMAWPYGYPEIMSSYDWSNSDQGPPSVGASTCSGGWLCEHRIRAIANMVSFANNTNAQFRVTNYWDNGNNQMAWGRGGLGFVAINREDSAGLSRTFATGMAAGTYCDIIHADFNYSTGACSGASITVDASGNATFSVSTHDAVAFHAGAVVGVPCPACGGSTSTSSSSSSAATSSASSSTSSSADAWYFRGTPNNWGSTAMTLSGGLYCTQQSFGAASTSPRFKIDHFANWTESYPTADYVVSANTTYNICFNATSHAITATAVGTSSSSVASTSSSSASSVASSASSSASGNVSVTFSCANGTTYSGQSVYVVGSVTALGNWTAASAVKLNPTSYPTWTGTIQLPANSSIQWKCLKREEVNPANGNVWQGGSNNVVNTGSGTSVSASF